MTNKHHIRNVGNVFIPSKKVATVFGNFIIDGEEWRGRICVLISIRNVRRYGLWKATLSALQVRMPMKGDQLIELEDIESVGDAPVRLWFPRRMRKAVRLQRKRWSPEFRSSEDEFIIRKGVSLETLLSHYGIY